MNYLKRAYHSIFFRKINTLMLFAIYLVISILVISGLSTYFGTKNYGESVKKEYHATITMKNIKRTIGTISGFNTIGIDITEKIAELEQVYNKKYTSSATALAIPNDFQSELSSAQKENYSHWASLSIYGNTSSEENSDFTSEKNRLAYGRHIAMEDTNQCIVSYNLYEKNGWSLGSEISLTGFLPSNNGISYTEPITLEIVGFYTFDSISDPNNSPEINFENAIYITSNTAMKINNLDKLYTVTYTIADPTDCDSFIESAKEIINSSGENAEDYTFMVDNTEYLRISTSLGSAVSISAALVILSIIMGIIIVTLLVINNLSDRESEIGILLSIGEFRTKVALQMMIENLIIVIAAISFSLLFVNIIAENVKKLISSYDINAMVGWDIIGMMYLVGIVISVGVSLISTYRIASYKPKKMLIDIE